MARNFYSLPDVDSGKRVRLFTLLGVPWVGTPLWWVSPIWMTLGGFAIGWLTTPGKGAGGRAAHGVAFAATVVITAVWHSVGHTPGGLLVGAPMRANLVNATLPVNLYDPAEEALPSRVHLTRGLAGGIGNLVVGLALLALGRGNRVVRFAAALNLFLVVGSLLPLPPLDGWVIVREWRRSR